MMERIEKAKPSKDKEQMLIKALTVSEMAELGYSEKIIDKIVENRKEMENKNNQ